MHLTSTMLFGMPGPLEWVVILIVVLLVVGPKRLPELMKSLAESIKTFKKAMKDDDPPSKTPSDKDKPVG